MTVRNNEAAEDAGFFLYENMRVPERSVISRVFFSGVASSRAEEDMDWWETSQDGPLTSRPIIVDVRRIQEDVYGLIMPRESK